MLIYLTKYLKRWLLDLCFSGHQKAQKYIGGKREKERENTISIQRGHLRMADYVAEASASRKGTLPQRRVTKTKKGNVK